MIGLWAAVVASLVWVQRPPVRLRGAVRSATDRAMSLRLPSRRRTVAGCLPAALEELARRLRSGSSVAQAIRPAAAVAGAPLNRQWSSVSDDVERGAALVEVLESWALASSSPDAVMAVASLTLGHEVGGARARAVDAAAATIRERAAISAEIRAQSAQARLSALVISAIPPVFLAWTLTTDRRARAFLFGSVVGWVCLGVGLMLDAVGAWWMRRVTRSVEGRC